MNNPQSFQKQNHQQLPKYYENYPYPTYQRQSQQFFIPPPINSFIDDDQYEQDKKYYLENLYHLENERISGGTEQYSENITNRKQSTNVKTNEQLKLFNRIKSITYINTQDFIQIPQFTHSQSSPPIQVKLMNLSDPSINAQSRDSLQILQQQQQPTFTQPSRRNVCSIEAKLEQDNKSTDDQIIIQNIIAEQNQQQTGELDHNKGNHKKKYTISYGNTFSVLPINTFPSMKNINENNNNMSMIHLPNNTNNNLLKLDTNNIPKITSSIQTTQKSISGVFGNPNPIEQQNNTNYVGNINYIQHKPPPPLSIPLITVLPPTADNIRIHNPNNITINNHYIPSQIHHQQSYFPPAQQITKMYPIPQSQQIPKIYTIPQSASKDNTTPTPFDDSITKKSRNLKVFNYNNRNTYDQYIPAMTNGTSTQLMITSSHNNNRNKLKFNTHMNNNHHIINTSMLGKKQTISKQNHDQNQQQGINLKILKISKLLNPIGNSSLTHKKNYSADLEQSKKKKLIVTISNNPNTNYQSCTHINKETNQHNNYNNSNPKTNIGNDPTVNKIIQAPKITNQQSGRNGTKGNRRGANAKNMQWKVMMKSNTKIDDEDNKDSNDKCPQWLCCQFTQDQKNLDKAELSLKQSNLKQDPKTLYENVKESMKKQNLQTPKCNFLQGNQMVAYENREMSKNRYKSLESTNNNKNYSNLQ